MVQESSRYYNFKAISAAIGIVLFVLVLEFLVWDPNSITALSALLYLNIIVCSAIMFSEGVESNLIKEKEDTNYQLVFDVMLLKLSLFVACSDFFHLPEKFHYFTGIVLLIGISPIIVLTINSHELVSTTGMTKAIMTLSGVCIFAMLLCALLIFIAGESFWMYVAPTELFHAI
ncbi:hypothetical protein L1286_12865 [Pseudoalteromonas sp. SMS1]|uniref:hypothetical protein n=1 Tax=Pseudoalteromonas sp. SMS1 TaxID=2908894 RepID=UPI001F3A2767|nr:hypothetical protein [Pseudoalteromonas sp. SMS1]MCF2858372.1 hypothetical protein [Pseudoalteromonas sp. SMS1]